MHEHVAQTGQIVDALHLSRVALIRPNKLRIDVMGNVRNSVLTYDGKVVTLLDPTQGFFAQLQAPATIDETLMLLMDKFQTSFPVTGALLADPYEKMKDGLTTAVDLGVVKVDDVVCRHLLFGEEDVDWQLWVDAGKRPLPRRLSVVYKKAPGAPRILAAFSDWKLNITVPASRFVFVKPAQAVQGEGVRVGDWTPVRASRCFGTCRPGASPWSARRRTSVWCSASRRRTTTPADLWNLGGRSRPGSEGIDDGA